MARRIKPIDQLLSETEKEALHRNLGPFSPDRPGSGSHHWSGDFYPDWKCSSRGKSEHDLPFARSCSGHHHGRTGRAVPTEDFRRDPGISVSFLITGLICALAALDYAELASIIPVAGSTYTYAYATLGELIAWIIGWDLMEYAVSNMAVAVGFSAYFNDVLESIFGIRLPPELSRPLTH